MRTASEKRVNLARLQIVFLILFTLGFLAGWFGGRFTAPVFTVVVESPLTSDHVYYSKGGSDE